VTSGEGTAARVDAPRPRRPGTRSLGLAWGEGWRRSPALLLTLGGAASMLPPLIWAVLGPSRFGSFASDLVVVLAAGAGVAGWALATEGRAFRRQLSSALSSKPRVPETPTVARFHQAVRGYEARLAGRLAAQLTAREALEEADRFETEFARSLSHELRTPLNAILGFTHVLLDTLDGPLTPGQREDLETIRASGELLRELVDEVLDLAALQSGRVVLDRRPVPVAPVLREVARLLEGQRRGKDLAIEVELAPGTPDLLVDPRRVRQILVNLGTNAVKFTDAGRVRFRAEAMPGEMVALTVEDTGPGIPRDELPTLFDEFQQLSGAVRKGQGTGLGLAIVRRLTELQGGRVTVESTVGVGSAFRVVLPAAGPDPRGGDAEADAAPDAGPSAGDAGEAEASTASLGSKDEGG